MHTYNLFLSFRKLTSHEKFKTEEITGSWTQGFGWTNLQKSIHERKINVAGSTVLKRSKNTTEGWRYDEGILSSKRFSPVESEACDEEANMVKEREGQRGHAPAACSVDSHSHYDRTTNYACACAIDIRYLHVWIRRGRRHRRHSSLVRKGSDQTDTGEGGVESKGQSTPVYYKTVKTNFYNLRVETWERETHGSEARNQKQNLKVWVVLFL